MLSKIRTVDILGKRFRVVRKKLSGHNGSIQVDRCVIEVDEKIDEEELGDVLVHESIHGFDVTLDLKITEKQTRSLGSCLFHWIRANRALVLAILEAPVDRPMPEAPKARRRK